MKRIRGLAPTGSNRLACYMVMLGMALVTCSGLATTTPAAGSMHEPDLLEAEKAFSVTARLMDDHTLELRYVIAPGYYMYRDRFRLSIDGQPVLLPRQAWPDGSWTQDATFGKVVTYRKSVRLLLPVPSKDIDGMQMGAKTLTLIAGSQGCADAGICYPPLRQTLVLVPGSRVWVVPQGDGSSPGFSHGGRAGSELADLLKSGK